MFAVHSLVVSFRAAVVLDDLDLTVADGHRIVLVGENGSGKSTVLGVLAGTITPDAGTVTRPPGRLGVQTQVPPWPPATAVAEAVAAATAWAERLTSAVTDAGTRLAGHPDDPAAQQALSDAIAAADAAQAWDAAGRADVLAAELGVDALDPDRVVGHLSGGQRGRLQLLGLFAAEPAGLLLDEPTNHLDDEAVAWLTERLRGFAGPVVVASHDRQLIDDVATGVLDLDPLRGRPAVVPGGWSAYRAHRELVRRQWEEAFAAHRAAEHAVAARVREVRRAKRTVTATDGDKFIPFFGARTAERTAAGTLRRARTDQARLAADRVPKPPATLHLRADRLAAAGPTGILLSAQDVAVDGRLAPTRLDVPAGARILVTGPNGVGKSTLLAVLEGSLHPTAGEVLRQPGVRIARLAQDVRPADPSDTPRAWYARATADLPDAPDLVALGLIRPRDLGRPVLELSVGQRRRLALAVVLATAPHVLLLDEPTDHLSLTLTDELEAALDRSPGAVVVASHDRWLRRRWEGDVHALRPARDSEV
ncbi:ABC-F family ATP-binding cassette domain-containing protein [Euzebya sp.]|uniref:ABC-F family ATP-binding cassette domain-containing protein n=1 Tax=Euzebya sp. TaxID=1971409 RepID=UPI00351201FB